MLWLLSGVSLWVLKSFRILAGNGAERKTVSQEFKSAWVSWLVCLLLVLSTYTHTHTHIYILSSLKLHHHREWVAEPNNTDFKGRKYLALVFKTNKKTVILKCYLFLLFVFVGFFPIYFY